MNPVVHSLGRAGGVLGRCRLSLPLVALFIALCEVIAIRVIYQASYGAQPFLSEAAAIAIGHLVLIGMGLAVFVTAVVGCFRLLRRGHPIVCAVAVPLLCFPLMIAGLASVYSSLVMAAII